MKESEKGKYAFLVSRFATKYDVKRAIKVFFQADVASVLTTTTSGKTKRIGTRRAETRLSPTKRAVVILKPGQTLGGKTEVKEEKPKKGKK
jgi:ribosomal protein L23